jgi:hypothetical protein
LEKCFEFAAGLLPGPGGKGGVPYHLSAYHPDWKWDAPAATAAELAVIAAQAKEKLAFVCDMITQLREAWAVAAIKATAKPAAARPVLDING